MLWFVQQSLVLLLLAWVLGVVTGWLIFGRRGARRAATPSLAAAAPAAVPAWADAPAPRADDGLSGEDGVEYASASWDDDPARADEAWEHRAEEPWEHRADAGQEWRDGDAQWDDGQPWEHADARWPDGDEAWDGTGEEWGDSAYAGDTAGETWGSAPQDRDQEPAAAVEPWPRTIVGDAAWEEPAGADHTWDDPFLSDPVPRPARNGVARQETWPAPTGDPVDSTADSAAAGTADDVLEDAAQDLDDTAARPTEPTEPTEPVEPTEPPAPELPAPSERADNGDAPADGPVDDPFPPTGRPRRRHRRRRGVRRSAVDPAAALPLTAESIPTVLPKSADAEVQAAHGAEEETEPRRDPEAEAARAAAEAEAARSAEAEAEAARVAEADAVRAAADTVAIDLGGTSGPAGGTASPTPDPPTRPIVLRPGTAAAAASPARPPAPPAPATPVRPRGTTPVMPPHDDLTRIDGVTPSMARALKASGLRRFRDIARSDAAELRAAIGAFGITPTFKVAYWPHHANDLAQEAVAEEAALREAALREAAAQPPPPEPPAAEPVAAPEVVVLPDAGGGEGRARADDLQRIEGITFRIDRALREVGITTFEDLAAAPHGWLRSALSTAGIGTAPTLPTWGAQARLLARGDEAGFAALRDRVAAGLDGGVRL